MFELTPPRSCPICFTNNYIKGNEITKLNYLSGSSDMQISVCNDVYFVLLFRAMPERNTLFVQINAIYKAGQKIRTFYNKSKRRKVHNLIAPLCITFTA